MAILGQITLDELAVYSVSADPSVDGFTSSIGSIALLDDDINCKMWIKSGSGNTAWNLIPRQANATQYAVGGVAFADPNGNLIVDTNNIYWDNTNNRLALGANSPIVPQSTIHLDRGTGIGVHVRMTAGATTGQAAGDGTEMGIDDTGAAEIRQYENSAINLYTNNLLRASVTAAGQLISGATSTAIDITGASAFPQFQIVGTTAVQMAGIQYSADTIGPVFNLVKSRAATIGTQTLVNSGDEFGRIQFRASDGVNFQAGASIRALVDGTASAGSMPGYMILMTTPTGATTPVERLRIDSTGQAIFASNIRLGNTSDTTNGNIRYDGTELLSRIAGAWRVISPTPISLSATGSITSTSATYTTMTSITTTPAAGTYLALFSCTAALSTDSSGDISLHVAAVEQTATTRAIQVNTGTVNTNMTTTLAFMHIVSVNGSQVVDVRFRENGAATMTVTQRELILIPLTR